MHKENPPRLPVDAYMFRTKNFIFWPWAPSQKATILAQGLEPLISFLAYLEAKSWPKKQKLDKN